MQRRTIQVFEYDRLRIGESRPTVEGDRHTFTQAEFDALLRFNETRREPALEAGHRSIRFLQYVGFIQVGRVGIEILPKADRGGAGGEAVWRDALLRMLRVAGRFPVSDSTDSWLARDQGTLLDVFVALFLDEVDQIVHRGLAKAYRGEECNAQSLSGRLLVSEHVRRNAVHKERFYVERTIYDADRPVNQVLRAALEALATSPLTNASECKRRGLDLHFEHVNRRRFTHEELGRVSLDRKTHSYGRALDLARLILTNRSPALRTGELGVTAMLFDMNSLWEAYVAVLMRRAAPARVLVKTQLSRLFWSSGRVRRRLRPDLVVVQKGTGEPLLVLDTKWKVPQGGVPSDADLKQMFAYNELLGTAEAVLVYPDSGWDRAASVGTFEVGGHVLRTAYLAVGESPMVGLFENVRRALGLESDPRSASA